MVSATPTTTSSHNNANDAYTSTNIIPDFELTHDDAASSYIDILSDDDNVTAIFLPRSELTSSPAVMDRNTGHQHHHHSLRYSLYGTIFNFINCIVGAGAIGLGGAMASSGGIISVIIIIMVAILVKLSLDLIIDLSINNLSSTFSHANTVHNNGLSASYEDLGYAAYGKTGKVLVMVSKFVYAFGCVVAYTIIIHDNFGPAIRHLFHIKSNSSDNASSSIVFRWLYWMIQHDVWCTWLVCTSVILPLSLMRDMSTLASTSFISIIAMISIVGIVVYMWYIDIGHHSIVIVADSEAVSDMDETATYSYDGSYNFTEITNYVSSLQHFHYPAVFPSVYRHWFRIRWCGLLNNMGTFVFSFVCHHTVHLTYRSLAPELQNLSTWKYVSTVSLCVSCIISLSVAVFCYMTFWDRTVSDIFQIYPDTYMIDMAKLLLCITMLLTFPLPFFTCRELLILLCFQNKTSRIDPNLSANNARHSRDPRQIEGDLFEDLNAPLMDAIDEDATRDSTNPDVSEESNAISAAAMADEVQPQQSAQLDVRSISTRVADIWNSALLPNDDRQLKFVYHVIVTCKLWFIITVLALAAPNLGDVLDFIGCCSGTLIAFILPGLFAIRLRGWTVIATITLLAGGIIGIIGTICSSQKLFKDTIR